VSVDGGAAVTSVHVQPVFFSRWQVLSQPSPEVVLPSSHSSVPNFRPSPQTAVQVPPWQWGSLVQVGEQPSYGMKFPSSHCSKPSGTPSPHTVLWQTDLAGVPVATQAQPCSSLQSALQPSFGVLFPSSHWSLPSTTPLPQNALRT